jgi:hypothetical protein
LRGATSAPARPLNAEFLTVAARGRVPSGERGQRVRVTAADMTALATQIDHLLTEFVTQLCDLEVAHTGTVKTSSPGLKSCLSQRIRPSYLRGRGVRDCSTREQETIQESRNTKRTTSRI